MLIVQITDIHIGFDQKSRFEMNKKRFRQTVQAVKRLGRVDEAVGRAAVSDDDAAEDSSARKDRPPVAAVPVGENIADSVGNDVLGDCLGRRVDGDALTDHVGMTGPAAGLVRFPVGVEQGSCPGLPEADRSHTAPRADPALANSSRTSA